MAITVKDIQEKEFTTQKVGGYNMEEVDDFLDALANQVGDMARDNLRSAERVQQLETELAAVKAELEQLKNAPKDDTPNDSDYFRNLEKAMRETLISSQRIAEDTVARAKADSEKALSSANAEAEKIVLTAKEKADSMIAEARAESDRLAGESERVKAAIAAYREGFRKLVEAQTAAMDAE